MIPRQHPDMKTVKHGFMTYRNGIVADALRKSGQPYSIIFGLQLPQLSQIARELEPSVDLGRALWSDRNVRESRLLAAWLFPVEALSEDEALAMARDVRTREEADILAFRLLRRHPAADIIASTLLSESEPLPHYSGEALQRNINA